LVVFRWPQSKLHNALTAEFLERDEVARVEFEAIASDHVDLFCGVATSDQPIGRPSTGIAPNNYDIPMPGSPLALDAIEPSANIENKVVSASLTKGPIDVETELNRRERDRHLGDVAFLIRREHTPSVVCHAGRLPLPKQTTP
jgi:hypothetical protein